MIQNVSRGGFVLDCDVINKLITRDLTTIYIYIRGERCKYKHEDESFKRLYLDSSKKVLSCVSNVMSCQTKCLVFQFWKIRIEDKNIDKNNM
jgi:hypothetical protein